ncbi:MAG: hypothetical protein JNN07_09020 [Verrucomicrobiales bacterium]|nr:hypothetical protein [Verrucomicrobiales bacterium]
MTSEDEIELHKLAGMLEAISDGLNPASPLREGLQKAGIALSLGFIHGLRADIERQYQRLNVPLSDEQRARLRRLGLDPDLA